MTYQNYSNFKLPVSMNILENGKLIEQIGNKYIFQLATTTNNVLVVNVLDNVIYNRLFKKGELILEYKDIHNSDNSLIRTIYDQRFTFKNNKLISTEILTTVNPILIYNSEISYNDIDSIQIAPFISNSNSIKLRKFSSLNKINLRKFSTNIIKLRKIKSKNVWSEFIVNFNNKIFTKTLFESKFYQFWKSIENQFTKDNHLFILLKIKYVNNEFATIGNLQRLNQEDKNWYIDWIINNMEFKSEYYNETQIESLIFSYGFKNQIIANKESMKSNINFMIYHNNKLIISFNPLDFGKLINKSELKNETLYILQSENNVITKILKSSNKNLIEIFKNGNSIIKFEDLYISENKFMRILNNKKYYFENGEQILYTKNIKSKFISKLQKDKNLINNFLILDIETYIKNNILIPFCISIYDGNKSKSFFLLDYKNVDDMILSALKSILIRKYNGYNVYMHNMAKFDIIFLFKYLVKLGTIKPIIHKDRLISIDLNFGTNNEYQLHFKDSYLILLKSLEKLCKAFSVENKKSIFPHFFVNRNNLNYEGEVPDFKYFGNKITQEEYYNYSKNFNRNWNLKNEAIKYCEIDCISLYQVIFKFNNLIFDLFEKNIHKYPTLPSLAFAIYRSNFMMKNSIAQLSGKIADDIRSGYTGGACDMYIPEFISKNNSKLKCYDVNSLYPSQMLKQDMPTVPRQYFNGNIRIIDPNAFGFFYCKIIAPDNIKHPILQTRVKTSNGIRTIAPIGQWEDMLFSKEMDNAIKFGYKFKILWGYTFEKENIFKDYVEFLYNLRQQYSKDNPMNFIAKILLNSLYGRFGMDDNFSEINVIHKDYFNDFENKYLD